VRGRAGEGEGEGRRQLMVSVSPLMERGEVGEDGERARPCPARGGEAARKPGRRSGKRRSGRRRAWGRVHTTHGRQGTGRALLEVREGRSHGWGPRVMERGRGKGGAPLGIVGRLAND
jgi:hypothetical protein